MDLKIRNRLTDLGKKLWLLRAKDTSGVWNEHAHTAVFKINKQQGPTALNSAQCYMIGLEGKRV